MSLQEENDRLRAENERLTKERDEWQEKWMALARAAMIIGGAHDERLRAALKLAQDLAVEKMDEWKEANNRLRAEKAAAVQLAQARIDECRELTTENERLRAALRIFVGCSLDYALEEAKRALGQSDTL